MGDGKHHDNTLDVREVDSRNRTDVEVHDAFTRAQDSAPEYVKNLAKVIFKYIKNLSIDEINNGKIIDYEIAPGNFIKVPSHTFDSTIFKDSLETTTLNLCDIDVLGYLLLHPARQFFGEQGIEIGIKLL